MAGGLGEETESVRRPADVLLRRRVRLLFHGALAMGLGLWLWAHSYPATAMLPWVVGIWIVGAAGLVWLASLVVLVSVRPRRRSTVAGFAVAPAMVSTCLALVVTGVPLQARWGVSQGVFDAVADSADPTGREAGRMGAYRVTSVEERDGVLLFYVGGAGFIDSAGFAFAPEGIDEPTEPGAPTFEAFDGDWYLFTDPF